MYSTLSNVFALSASLISNTEKWINAAKIKQHYSNFCPLEVARPLNSRFSSPERNWQYYTAAVTLLTAVTAAIAASLCFGNCLQTTVEPAH